LKTYIGIDNGVTGNIGIIWPNDRADWCPTPTFQDLDYLKTKARYISRIDTGKLERVLATAKDNPFILLERPLVNPQQFFATCSAMRSLEATLIVIERLKIPMQFVDSKAWQKDMLPKGITGSGALKEASLLVAGRLYPSLRFVGDADGMLIALWAKRKGL
jgi:hypothetical protein